MTRSVVFGPFPLVHPVVVALNVAIAVLGGASALPQTWRLLRTRVTAGLSGAAVVLGVVFQVAWVVYTGSRHRPGPLIADMLYLVTTVLLAVAAARAGLITRAAATVAGLAGTGLVVVAAGGHAAGAGWVPLGVVLAVQQGVVGVPALAAAWRSDTLDGVSPGTLLLTLGSAATCGPYGLLVGDGPLLLWAALTAATNGPILARYLYVRRRGVAS